MKNSYVFDTGPLSLYMVGDKRITEPIREVSRGSAVGFTGEANLAELYYKTCEKLGRETAVIRYNSIRNGPLIIVPPDKILSRMAGELKCAHRSQLSVVDAYTVSLAKSVDASLYTTDSRIFKLKIVPTRLIELQD